MTPGSQVRALLEISRAENAISIRVEIDHIQWPLRDLVTMRTFPVQWELVILRRRHRKDEKEKAGIVN